MMRSRYLALRTAHTVMYAGLTVILAMMGIVAGPWLEAFYAPPVSDFSFRIVSNGAGAIVIDWSGVKHRECKLLTVNANVLRAEGWVAADITRADGSQLTPRDAPTGRQWFRRLVISPPGDAMRMVLRYECHRMWDTVVTPEVRLAGEAEGPLS